MIKTMLVSLGIKLLTGAIILGVGVWYLSSSLGGASLSYTSVSNFMKQVGVTNGDVASANGCFLCGYIEELFDVLGRATEMFWNGIVHNLWILMAIGFGIFIILHTVSYIRDQAKSKDIKDLSGENPKLDFSKWFEKVWKTGVRVIISGALIGALSWSGTGALKAVTNLTVTPVMYVGSMLSIATTDIISNAHCDVSLVQKSADNILTPVLKPFMCVMGNLNTVMLAGAGGGFALMNYSWLGLGGGLFTWLAGLALVLVFLVIGFDLVFQILSVIFKLIFIIIFMPILLAGAAFEEVWSLAKGLVNISFDMLVNSAVSIIKISLKICLIYALVYFSADNFYPGPEDGFTTIMPPLLGKITKENPDAQTMSVINVFSECEQVSLIDNKMDKDKFVNCFNTQKKVVTAKYPGAFDFMDDGFYFLMFMFGVWFLYFWIVSPKIDEIIGNKSKDTFDYGKWLKDFGTTVYKAPAKLYEAIKEKLK